MVLSRNVLTLMVACLAWAPAGAASAAPERPDDTGAGPAVARVNGEPVTEADLRRALTAPAERRRLLEEHAGQGPGDAELGRLALRRLIHRRLILQEAGRRGYTVTEQELGRSVAALRRRFDDLGAMGAWMKEQGLDDRSLFDAVRDDLLAARVRGALVAGVRLDDGEVRRYEEAHAKELEAEQVWLQAIVVEDRAAAEALLAALRRGEDFGALARRHSRGARAQARGDLGWVEVEALGPPLREAVRTLRTGEARGPLQRGDDLLIVRLEARRMAPRPPAARRLEIERRLLPAAHAQAVRAWLAEQESKADIELVARDRVAGAGGR